MPRSRRPQTLTPPPFTGSADNFVTKDGVLGAQSTSSVQRDGVRNHAVLVLQRDCTEHRLTGAVHIAGRAASLPVAERQHRQMGEDVAPFPRYAWRYDVKLKR
jgi:hypothetical protein